MSAGDARLSVGPIFPVDTVVDAYEGLDPNGKPIGAAVASAIVGADGDLTFTGLNAGQRYVAAAELGGEWVYVYFPVEDWDPTPLTEETTVGGVLRGTIRSPDFASDMATQAELDAVAAMEVGGDLRGRLPNPEFAVDMATQAELDAAERAAADALAPVSTKLDNLAIFNVKDYGAVGDGATDDAAAIQAAIDAARTAGGGEVYFPLSMYLVSEALILYSNVHLKGHGQGTAILRLDDAAEDHLVRSDSHGAVSIEDASIRDLSFDGNDAGQTGAFDVLRLDGVRLRVEGVTILDSSRDGLHLSKSNADDFYATGGLENLVSRVRVANAARNGIRVESQDAVIDTCFAVACATSGIHMATIGLIVNCHVWRDSETGFNLNGGVHCVNCVAEGASRRQVLLAGSGNSWVGGEVFSGGSGWGPTGAPGFEWPAGAGSNTVRDTYVHDTGDAGGYLFATGVGFGSHVSGLFYDPGASKPAVVGTPSTVDFTGLRLGGSSTMGAGVRNLSLDNLVVAADVSVGDDLEVADELRILPTGLLRLEERASAPAAPSANRVAIYAIDNGAGKTQIMALFSSGAAVQIAIQP